ncbi:retron-type reverse transcriptase [Azospirillum baldaniorum]|uniref:reverse transcriptase domain-containing protein n=1 Tax=Azospirillum baldaniorum TaxID=1064539 RepID=UPI0011AD80A7|nr:reverse transcriptase domain-containing protein [Azospirillum baldaniorum]TWA66076.1 retron-type reverse transcriptase [Azospirillum baldaniorum]
MAVPLLHKIAHKRNLKHVWDASPDAKGRKKACGLDKVRSEDFGSKISDRIDEISRALIDGSFRFSDLKAVAFPKSDPNKYRIICIPTVADRLVQRAIAGHLLSTEVDRLKIKNVVSHGFLKERGVASAVREASKLRRHMPWALKSDIFSFFDEIDRTLLLARVRKVIRSKAVYSILEQVVNCEIGNTDPDTRGKIEKTNIRRGKGLRQGMPLSPILSNFFLSDFDAYFIDRRENLLRYADDFIIFAETEEECRSYYDVCLEQLQKLDLKIPDLGDGGKTEIFEPDRAAEFLGYEIAPKGDGAYRVLIPKRAFGELTKKVNSFAADANRKYKSFDSALHGLTNVIDGYMNAYHAAENSASLENHLKILKVECRRRMFEEVFGREAVSLLPSHKKVWLAIR